MQNLRRNLFSIYISKHSHQLRMHLKQSDVVRPESLILSYGKRRHPSQWHCYAMPRRLLVWSNASTPIRYQTRPFFNEILCTEIFHLISDPKFLRLKLWVTIFFWGFTQKVNYMPKNIHQYQSTIFPSLEPDSNANYSEYQMISPNGIP